MEPTTLSMSSAMPNIHAWDYLVVTSIFSALLALCAKIFTNVSSFFAMLHCSFQYCCPSLFLLHGENG